MHKLKRTKFYNITLAVVTILLVTACSSTHSPKKKEVGTVLGAMIGGIIGANINAGKAQSVVTTGTAALGGLFGASIGASLDEKDIQMHKTAEVYAYESKVDEEFTWYNPESGNSGSVRVIKETNKNGSLCKEFKHTIKTETSEEEVFGIACKSEDGTWQVEGRP